MCDQSKTALWPTKQGPSFDPAFSSATNRARRWSASFGSAPLAAQALRVQAANGHGARVEAGEDRHELDVERRAEHVPAVLRADHRDADRQKIEERRDGTGRLAVDAEVGHAPAHCRMSTMSRVRTGLESFLDPAG